ncbi:MAG TPA: PadR family transcriptional regulator [Bacillales bacterium]|nr:PadR family transcriptional regulator [Bacillales bacterium]
MENTTEMLKGVLEGCVLEIISHGETYGYEITQKLRELGFTDVVAGTVYAITIRLEKNNLVDIKKKPSTKGPPRKFYTLNAAGQKRLETFWRNWEQISGRINELNVKRKSKGEVI